jgi:hypothetical protein
VSIGLPVYNGEEWLAQSVDSLLRQTFADFELIIFSVIDEPLFFKRWHAANSYNAWCPSGRLLSTPWSRRICGRAPGGQASVS